MTHNDNACLATQAGYDAPEEDLGRDYLGRRQVAATLYNLVVGTPQDWSTRVGLFGAWGEGKTTVCKFVERLARDDGHIVLWFDPWAARSIDELWAAFAERLIDGLEAAGVNVEGTVLAKFFGKARKITDLVERLAEINISPRREWVPASPS
jgi:predicted KAP-like P-loop ATPase